MFRLWSKDPMLDRLLVDPPPILLLADKLPELPFSFVSSRPAPFPGTKGGRFSSLEITMSFVMPFVVPFVVMWELKWP